MYAAAVNLDIRIPFARFAGFAGSADMQPVVVYADIGVAAFVGLASRAAMPAGFLDDDHILVGGKQRFLQNPGCGHHQHCKQEEFPPRELRDPGCCFVEASGQIAGGGLYSLLPCDRIRIHRVRIELYCGLYGDLAKAPLF